MYEIKYTALELIANLFLLICVPFIILYVLIWSVKDGLKRNVVIKKLTGALMMGDCEKIIIWEGDKPKSAALIFTSKKQIMYLIMRLFYMLFSRSNRIGNELHLVHMETTTGIEFTK